MSASPAGAASAQGRARALMRRFDAHMLTHGSEKNALLDSGVSAAKVETLYPFDIGDYQAAVVATLLQPKLLTRCALVLGGGLSLKTTLTHLPYEAYARAENTIWQHDFFDTLPEELTAVVADLPHSDATTDNDSDINGNAVYLMRQWGYLLLFLHECAGATVQWEHPDNAYLNPEYFAITFTENEQLAQRLLTILALRH